MRYDNNFEKCNILAVTGVYIYRNLIWRSVFMKKHIAAILMCGVLAAGCGSSALAGCFGWQGEKGGSSYIMKNGSSAKGVLKIGGVTYKFDGEGTCLGKFTGWVKKNGRRVYYSDGVTLEGWQNVDGNWYFFEEGGYAVTGEYEMSGFVLNFSKRGVWNKRLEGADVIVYASAAEKRLNNNYYSGCYVDGDMIIICASEPDKLMPTIEKWREKYPAIYIREMKYSKAELTEVRTEIEENMRAFGITSLALGYKENTVWVTVESMNSELSAYLDSLPHKDMVHVEEGVAFAIEE